MDEGKIAVVKKCALCGDKFTPGAPIISLMVKKDGAYEIAEICEECAINTVIVKLGELFPEIIENYQEIIISNGENNNG